jgi:hypothetical protein
MVSRYESADIGVLDDLQNELRIGTVEDPDDWEWYYRTLTKSELIDIVKQREARQ